MDIGLYRVCFEVGSKKPGAPLLRFDGLVDAPTGRVTGQAQITQAIAPPGGSLTIHNVTGRLHQFTVSPQVRLLNLSGSWWESFPPPAIGEIERKFTLAAFIEKDAWKGGGSFSYGTNEVTDVPLWQCSKEED
jgi:hypothetical protein